MKRRRQAGAEGLLTLSHAPVLSKGNYNAIEDIAPLLAIRNRGKNVTSATKMKTCWAAS
jgi:hypothetical protein